MNKKVFFRCEASKEIGLGHLTRCLALASMLKDDFQICFLFKIPTYQSSTLLNGAFNFLELKADSLEKEIIQVNSILTSDDILVVDGYQFTDEYFNALDARGIKLVLVDDFGKTYPYARLVINHALGLAEQNMLGKTRYCLGEKYVMLRPDFLKKAKQKRAIESVRRVFVCFGGADYHNITLKIMQAFESMKSSLTIDIVLASTFPFKKEVEDFAGQSSLPFKLHYSLSAQDMANLMGNCELAVAPASSLSYEVCAVGMGFIGGYYVDNQLGIHNGFLERGCMLSVGDFSKFASSLFINLVNELMEDNDLLNKLLIAQRKVVDGESDKNILNVFSAL